jgi:regulation of enolase protein 1 (concanavalin A-like superfamily)
VKFYFGDNSVDAVLDVTKDYAGRGAVNSAIGRLAIGHFNSATRAGALDRMFRGVIDNVQIYGDALTGTQIVQAQRGSASGLPSPWASQDIGAVGVSGSTTHSSGTFTVKGSGSNIWYNADGFQFAYQTMSGDGSIVARVASIQNTHSDAKAGVMIRESLAPGSKHTLMNLTPTGDNQFVRRIATSGASTYTSGGIHAAPYWVRLVRSGSSITASISANGSTWTTVGSETLAMTANVYVGLAVVSINNSILNTSTFDNVTVVP